MRPLRHDRGTVTIAALLMLWQHPVVYTATIFDVPIAMWSRALVLQRMGTRIRQGFKVLLKDQFTCTCL